MATWIHRFDLPDPVPQGVMRIAVKDAIDVAGVVTTAGCVAVRDRALPARVDAWCLAGVRAAAALIVGKTTLTELCLGHPEGFNPDFGTPVNPLAPLCIPGGSSSGSAVAVAADVADIGLGTDTGGSIRLPAACCGIVGLKTTWGRVPTSGVWPLAPSLDTIGPLARTVAGVAAGMRMIASDWRPVPQVARVVGRLRLDSVDRGRRRLDRPGTERHGVRSA
jgi:amidase